MFLDRDMKYTFTKFEGHYSRGDTKIGINKSGLMRLSAGFCKETNIKQFKYAILFYDPYNKAIAFKPTNDKKDAVFKITSDDNAATISVKSFILANNIDLKNRSKRYEWKTQNLPAFGEVYIIDLKKA
jgi:hypothetical protein